jgi:hypothetical protein
VELVIYCVASEGYGMLCWIRASLEVNEPILRLESSKHPFTEPRV